ncbi:NAD-dependent epimerase/dehydratase family protein [Lachnospiraceae bacterium C1.1]|nr:NAD(P)-dependent oxidoreductase [Lachnospiraceae bacterium C1.1]
MTKNEMLISDFRTIINDKGIDHKKFEESSVLITGATGLVGSLLVRYFCYLINNENINLRVFALVRDKKKAETIYSMDEIHKISFIESDIVSPDLVKKLKYEVRHIDYLIHCAAITNSKVMIEKPVETIESSIIGTENILKFCKESSIKSAVYLSSMEAYGSMDIYSTSEAREDKLGIIDITKVRSNYPESKRMCENMCVAYHSEYGVPVKTARLAQTFGAGVLPWENRVFAQFAKSVINEEDIVLHTEGKSEGNYCYTTDSIRGILYILLKGKNAEIYNVTNEKSHTSIANMAKMVAEEVAYRKIKVVFDIPETNKFGYAADTKLHLNADKLRALGWIPNIGLRESFERLIEYMKCDRQSRERM